MTFANLDRATTYAHVDLAAMLCSVIESAEPDTAALTALRCASRVVAAHTGWGAGRIWLVTPGSDPDNHAARTIAGAPSGPFTDGAHGPGPPELQRVVRNGVLTTVPAALTESAMAGIVALPVPPEPDRVSAILTWPTPDLREIDGPLRRVLHAIARFLAMPDGADSDGARPRPLRSVRSLSGGVLIKVDADGHIADWSDEAQEMFGWAEQDVVGKPLSDAVLMPESSQAFAATWAELMTPQPAGAAPRRRLDVVAQRCGRGPFPAEVEFWEVRVAGSSGLIVGISDITDRKQRERYLEDQAQHDPLTGLANREKLYAETSRALAGEGGTIAVLFLDLDGFKQVNDTLGHDIGDRLLDAVASRLRAAVRPQDTVARVGGDEFVIAAPGIGTRAAANLVAQRVRVAFSSPINLAGEFVRITPSIGVAVATADTRDAHDLIHQADVAMYHAKNKRRARTPHP
jgi:diguanylate cyclase (GGDEF)-like protein/PAS domain S-box-containing protein